MTEVRSVEHARTPRTARLLDDLRKDVRGALRSLARRPGFTTAAVLTLALGIGANVAMFSVANLALLRALPFPESDRLVVARTLWPGGGIGTTVSAPDYYDVREQATSFESLVTLTPFTSDVTITGGGEPERVSRAWASPGLFRTLGATPVLGREFVPAEGEPGADPGVLLGHEFWQRRFGGDRRVVGTTLTVDGEARTVIGILPPGFAFVADADVWMPMVRGGTFATARQFHNWMVVGRVRPGTTLAAAQAELDVIMRRLAAAYPESNRGKGMLLTGLQEAMIEGFRPSLLMLMGGITLVLLIACGNVASLLLARGTARRTELALRSALGAARARLVRQLLTENTVLGLGAGALGTLAALALQRSLVAATPLTRLGLEAAGVQPEVLLFALALSLVTVLVFGLAPALAATRTDLTRDLKAGSRSVASGGGAGFRNGLVVAQVALSVVLLVGAGLLLRSFARLRSVDPGFTADALLTAEIGLPSGEYRDAEQRVRFFTELLERARAIPDVRAAGLVSRLPIRDPGANIAAWDAAHPPADASEQRLAFDRVVLPGYFQALGIPLTRGRDIRPTDAAGAPPVIVINETMARTLFPDQDPLGRRLAVDRGDAGTGYYEVVGVVGDVHISGLSGAPPMVMYASYLQRPLSTMRIAARAAGAGGAAGRVVGPLREILRQMDPDIPLAGARSMDDVLAGSVAFTRTVTGALGAFAGVALFLAALGLYGVLAFQVVQRLHEIGIRVALGAGAREVFGLVLRRGLTLVGGGLVLGMACAIAAARLIRELLFEVRATDPATFLAVAGFFAGVALVACLIPAWRAWRVDPMIAFRAE